ncbi:hypothetical protein [Brevibacillus nitrificans]|uniref:hypothetical protein n=1 Tax=Brevibacillus nitrificans TaxID=651560 RepID=UPI00285F8D24|nr:hypothetical protein [Brevibacillus nitrificans]MDR7317722.1 hypothetical protein [Brevibacillus nitrificans]
MAKLSLAALVPIRSDIANKVTELDHERERNAFSVYVKGEKAEEPTRSFALITKELEEAREDFRVIDELIHSANLANKIQWNQQEVSLFTAMQIAKHMRKEAASLKRYGSSKKEEINTGAYFNGGDKTITRAMYDIDLARENALKLERKVKRLSQLIEDECHTIILEFPQAEKYIELED